MKFQSKKSFASQRAAGAITRGSLHSVSLCLVKGVLSCPRGEVIDGSYERHNCNRFASLWGGCGVHGALAVACETILRNPSARGEFQNSPEDCFERGLLLPQGSKDILQDANKNCTYWVIMFILKNVILMRYKSIFKIDFH